MLSASSEKVLLGFLSWWIWNLGKWKRVCPDFLFGDVGVLGDASESEEKAKLSWSMIELREAISFAIFIASSNVCSSLPEIGLTVGSLFLCLDDNDEEVDCCFEAETMISLISFLTLEADSFKTDCCSETSEDISGVVIKVSSSRKTSSMRDGPKSRVGDSDLSKPCCSVTLVTSWYSWASLWLLSKDKTGEGPEPKWMMPGKGWLMTVRGLLMTRWLWSWRSLLLSCDDDDNEEYIFFRRIEAAIEQLAFLNCC